LELRRYFLIFRKWAWFVILVAVISAVSSYFYSLTIPPTYRAETTMVVGKVVENTNSVYFPYEIPGSLAQAYGLLVGQPVILQATAEAIGQPEAWQNLFFKISAKSSTNSQLLQLGVTDSDPVFAARIANELAQQLILKGPISSQQKEAEEQRAFVSSQLGQLKLQIESSQKNLNSLSSQAALENDPKRLEDLNSRIASLQSKIAEWQKNYASLLAIQNSGSNLFVTVLAPAQPPKTPISPNVLQNVLLAAAAGLALAIGVVFLLEYLDDTIKDADDVQRVLGVSSLGAIMRIASVREPGDQLITLRHPRSPIAEAYRVLRTNLRFSGIENPSGALLVTSAGPGEGKTTTAANLAITMAQAGRRVVLVDCDLRRPSLHKLFGLSNEEGLSSLFLDSAPSLENIMYATRLESLKVIPSGPVPPNPAEMLDSNLMKRVFSDLRAQSDMLILDSPPTLAVADASILGARCSGAILVVDAGRTRTDACRRAVDTLGNTGTKILGVVLNKISSRRASSYYYYYYYSSKEKGKQAAIDQPPQAPPEPVVQPMKSK
jgi:non-specific protein-tyrosine kinase